MFPMNPIITSEYLKNPFIRLQNTKNGVFYHFYVGDSTAGGAYLSREWDNTRVFVQDCILDSQFMVVTPEQKLQS